MKVLHNDDCETCLLRRQDEGQSRIRKQWPMALCISHVALLVILAVTLPLGEAHRQRLPSQVSSTAAPSIAPTGFPSLSLTPNPSFYSILESNSAEPSQVPARRPSRSMSTSPSWRPSSLPTFVPSPDPTLSGAPTSHPSTSYPSLSPTTYPSLFPTESPTDPFEFRTDACSFDSSIVGYDELDTFLMDMDEVQVEKPFVICPNVTFEDAKIVIQDRDVPLNIECGGEECVWLRTKLIITGPTAPVTFRGIIFEGSTETVLVVSGTDAMVFFEDCSWFGNSGSEIIRIDGEKPIVGLNDTSDTQSNSTYMGNGTIDSQSGDASTGSSTFNDQSDSTNSSNISGDLQNNTMVPGNDQNITGGENGNSDVHQNDTLPGNSTGENQVAATRFLIGGRVSVSFRLCSFVVRTKVL